MSTPRDQLFMEQAIELALHAQQEGEIPVGAVVVYQDEVIGRGWNRSISCHDASHHAEIMALREAGQVLKNYRLIDTTLYVTLEPCPMCAGAMVHARVAKLVYGASDPKTGAAGSVFNLVAEPCLNHQLEIVGGVEQERCSTLLSEFFRNRRKAIRSAKKLKSSQQG
ncbi:tRNA adenosine(34) deaminase TadA [Celerinatantimonas yamalensis]|uniref:tRNA-specific adenosine deaminase n=1 Tax=Celerinatantimonas yamalensis TaxID=559956 RepID=A0ABW9G9Q2_9GAMM